MPARADDAIVIEITPSSLDKLAKRGLIKVSYSDEKEIHIHLVDEQEPAETGLEDVRGVE